MFKKLFLGLFIITGLVTGCFGMADSPVCPICRESIAFVWALDSENVAMTTEPLFGCKHPELFHAQCLAEFLRMRGECPLCRGCLFGHLPYVVLKVLSQKQGRPDMFNINDIGSLFWGIRWDVPERLFLNLSGANVRRIDGHAFAQLADRFPELSQLYLYGTQLVELSPEIRQLQNLRYIDIGGTQLATLPLEINQLPHLEMLIVINTPMLNTPGWPAFRAQLLAAHPGLSIIE